MNVDSSDIGARPIPEAGPNASAPILVPRVPSVSLADEFRRSLRFLYNHNPFYVISAALVLRGVRQLFEPTPEAPVSWLALGMLASYVLLMMATTIVVVRWGKVWEDARTLVLIIVILFLSFSMLFDELVITNPSRGGAILLICLGLSILGSEFLRSALRFRLPFWYRAAYFALLATFFIYPWFLTSLYRSMNPMTMGWGTYGFSLAAGASFLLLAPAVRNGAGYVRDNGTPWEWPWYPTPLYVVLLMGCAIRSFLLTRSFQPEQGRLTMFGLYFLSPMIFAVAVLLFEIALTSRARLAVRWALWAPIVLVASSWFDVERSYSARLFFLEFIAKVGSPVYVALIAAGCLYALAWFRGLRLAEAGAAVCLVTFCFVSPRTVDLATMTPPRAAPLMALTALWTIAAVREPTPRRVAATLAAGVGASTILAQNSTAGIYLLFGMTSFAIAGYMSFLKARVLRRLKTSAQVGGTVRASPSLD